MREEKNYQYLDIEVSTLLSYLPKYYDDKVRLAVANNRVFVIHPEFPSVMIPYHKIYTLYLIQKALAERIA